MNAYSIVGLAGFMLLFAGIIIFINGEVNGLIASAAGLAIVLWVIKQLRGER